MAITSLSDIIEPKVFAQYVAEQTTAKSALLASGAVLQSDTLNEMADERGLSPELPFFVQDANGASDVAKDDDTVSTPSAVSGKSQRAQKDLRSKSWSTAALTNSVVGEDILGHVASNVVAPYWAADMQARLISKLSGVEKDNIANDDGDMGFNIASDSVDPITADERASIDAVIEAKATMGDAGNQLTLIVMHSRVFYNLLKLEPTNCERASATVPFNTYLGHSVIIDDNVPAVAGTNRTSYTTYLLGEGAILRGTGTPEMGAVEVIRNGDQGNGWGTEKFVSRTKEILHPAGFASSATVASSTGSPTNTAYNTAGAWDRVVDRKNAKIAFLKTNG